MINLSLFFLIIEYIRYAHNRPFELGIGAAGLLRQEMTINKHLVLFLLLSGPIVLFLITMSPGLTLNDLFDIHLSGSTAEVTINNSPNLINNSGLLLLLSRINNKIPTWVKLAFKLFIISIIILKLLGYSIITDVLNDLSFLRKLLYIGSSLVIIFDLLNLYLLHKFASQKVVISPVLPDFMINWLKEFEVLSSTKLDIKEFKKECYINISIYLVIMTLVTIF